MMKKGQNKTEKFELRFGRRSLASLLFACLILFTTPNNQASSRPQFKVYNINQELSMGKSDENLKKDFYINLGRDHGIEPGTLLKVRRRVSTYDLKTKKLYRDMSLPLAVLKVIHVESKSSVARFKRFLPKSKNPVVSPRAVMVGDGVEVMEK